eukprot:2273877-Rhodomonas_salina.3
MERMVCDEMRLLRELCGAQAICDVIRDGDGAGIVSVNTPAEVKWDGPVLTDTISGAAVRAVRGGGDLCCVQAA